MEMKLHVQNNIAEEFNNFFVGIGESLGNSIPLPSGTFHNYLNGHYPINFFYETH